MNKLDMPSTNEAPGRLIDTTAAERAVHPQQRVREYIERQNAQPLGFEPLGNLVLIRVDAPEAVSAGGVLLPDAAQDKPSQGEVLAVGPDCERLDVGDRVVFQKYTGTDVELEGELYLAVKETEVLGRLKVKLAT